MIGNVGIGGNNPIRVQSMTTTDTMDTEATVAQSIRMIEAGCEIVRITAPSRKEAENLKNIKKGLEIKGYNTPLVADIHFTPNAAEIAARIVEKVRVNPGNYADKKRFEHIDYTDETYQEELNRIKEQNKAKKNACDQRDMKGKYFDCVKPHDFFGEAMTHGVLPVLFVPSLCFFCFSVMPEYNYR